MKKQSASTIKLLSIDDINKRDAIKKLKAALIGIGLRYMPENEDNAGDDSGPPIWTLVECACP